jgi:hypothetical protein
MDVVHGVDTHAIGAPQQKSGWVRAHLPNTRVNPPSRRWLYLAWGSYNPRVPSAGDRRARPSTHLILRRRLRRGPRKCGAGAPYRSMDS